MGNHISRLHDETITDDNLNCLNNPTPADPRSPTPDIVRTPLKNSSTTNQDITKNIDLNKALDNYNLDVVNKSYRFNPVLMTVMRNHLQEFDPRSPTIDFERTPIMLEKSEPNKAGGFSDRGQHDCSINDSAYGEEEANGTPIIRNLNIGLAEISMDDSYKNAESFNSELNGSLKSCEGQKYLETNFDFVEVCTEESNDVTKNVSQEQQKFSTENAAVELTNHDFAELHTENINKYGDAENLSQKQNCSPENVAIKLINKHNYKDPRSPSVGINRTPIVLPKPYCETEEISLEKESHPKIDVRDLRSHTKELRSAVGHALLIYEDNNIEQPITPQKIKTNAKARTPLSCVKNKTELLHTRSQSVTASAVNAKADTKHTHINQKKLSKIPRPKHVLIQEKFNRNSDIMSDNKNIPLKQRSSWDHDSSVVL